MRDLTTWLHSPETQTLVRYLQHRRATAVQIFLAGNPVPPEMQGRAAALYDLEKLLTSAEDVLRREFEQALAPKGANKT